MKDPRFPDWLEFFPQHPSDEKTREIQTVPSAALEGVTEPIEARDLLDEFKADPGKAIEKYTDTRFTVTGVVKTVELDMHNLPSVQLSDTVDGEICALCIFPSEHGLPEVDVGQRVDIRGNYLVYSDPLGIIFKLCELTD